MLSAVGRYRSCFQGHGVAYVDNAVANSDLDRVMFDILFDPKTRPRRRRAVLSRW